jgi:hypothetical protein
MSYGRAGSNVLNQHFFQSIFSWRIAQFVFWLAGVFILSSLLFYPSLGIMLFWNILIPVAPALFVVALGIWRNICPLATTVLFPRHLGLSQKRKLTPAQSGKLNLIAVLLLFTIVPLRHAVFNANGWATGLLILSMALLGIGLGFVYEWKSAWCSGLCPVHPVEKLYGSNIVKSFPNAHCHECMNCVKPCPDSTPNIHPQSATKTNYHKLSGILITGGLPGFIWGWFHVPDENITPAVHTFLNVYGMPLAGLAVTLIIYIILKFSLRQNNEQKLSAIFAASGVSCYYWFRIPALLGFGEYGSDGLLIDLSNLLPSWSILAFTTFISIFFFYWLVIRKPNKRSWVIRPGFAKKIIQAKEKFTA